MFTKQLSAYEDPGMVTWIKGGDVVDPVKGVVEKTDLIIEKGKVAKILPPGVFNDKIP